jgi:hypothetical protein
MSLPSLKRHGLAAVIFAGMTLAGRADAAEMPVLVGSPWPVAGNPNLGELTSPGQQPVDFAIWKAADGTWQLCSCIRGTKEIGKTRLLYRWEGAKLTDTNWKPMGIALRADPNYGEVPGGLQAPYVFQAGGKFVMFYGCWEDICSATSPDGKTFTRQLNADGKAPLFRSSEGNQTRDPMVLRIGDLWICYYTAYTSAAKDGIGADYGRTSKDLVTWGESHTVARGGQAGSNPFSCECPFVVELHPGAFYLFRTQHYGKNAQTSVYFSHDPLDFGVDHDEGHYLGTLPVAAPELFQDGGQWYLAALRADLHGIEIHRLAWK